MKLARIRKALATNPVQRMLHYIETRKSHFTFNARDEKNIENIITNLKKLSKEIQTYSTIRLISFIIIYAGLATGLLKTTTFLEIFDNLVNILIGTLGAAFFIFIIWAMTSLINIRTTDAHTRAASAISIIENKGKPKRMKSI